MKSVFDIYRPVAEECTQTYFAGANTALGYVGECAVIADEQKLERVYIIKGDAGREKNIVLRKCADMAENAGLEVTYFRDGSDETSLDCVVIDCRIAVLDGSYPNNRDMIYPGAVSELIDISKFLREDILSEQRESIIAYTEKKADCFTSAHRYLAAVELLEREKAACTNEIFLSEKAEGCIDRFIAKLGRPKEKKGTVNQVYTHALTTSGAVFLKAFENSAETRFTVTDQYGCAVPFMKMLAEKLTDAGHSLTIAKLPSPDVTAGIYIADSRTSVTVEQPSDDSGKIFNTARFLASEFPDGVRGRFRLAAKIQQSCIEEALSCLKKAAEYQLLLDKIYSAATEREALDAYLSEICEKIRVRLL